MTEIKFRKYWVGTDNFSWAVILVERYDHSLQMFQLLFEEAKKDFPNLNLTAQDVECFNVVKSSNVKGCPMIKFDVHGPVADKEGYHRTLRLNDIEWWT